MSLSPETQLALRHIEREDAVRNHQDAIREVLNRLDLEAQLQAELQLRDALARMPAYEPTPEDLADYHAWCLQVERTNWDRWMNDIREPD